MNRYVWIILLLNVVLIEPCTDRKPDTDNLRMVSVGGGGAKSSNQKFPRDSESQSDEWESFKIYAHFAEEHYVAADSNLRYLKEKIFVDIFKFFEKAFKVRKPPNKSLIIGRECKNSPVFPDFGFGNCKGGCKEEEHCNGLPVPYEHLTACSECNENGNNCSTTGVDGEGVDAHFILYFSMNNDEACQNSPNIIAFASSCRVGTEELYNRPIAGSVNICPEYMGAKFNPRLLEGTLRHEILHAIVMDLMLFPFFRDEDGNPRSERAPNGYPLSMTVDDWKNIYMVGNTTILDVERDDWWTATGKMKHKVKMLVTPKVKQEVRDHFNCPDLEGAELEDQLGNGEPFPFAYGHFEKRLFADELMSASVTTGKKFFSRLTFATMEDSGWYKANYSYAEELEWGKGLGCDFVKKSCGEWMEMKKNLPGSWDPYCVTFTVNTPEEPTRHLTCDAKKQSIVNCMVFRYPMEIAPQYQNFKEIEFAKDFNHSHYGGVDPTANFCPIPSIFQEWNGDLFSSSVCGLERDTIFKNRIEIFDESSKCFETDLMLRKNCTGTEPVEGVRAVCLKTQCREDGVLYIKTKQSQWYPCYGKGRLIGLEWLDSTGSTTQGHAVCPACEEFCDMCANGLEDSFNTTVIGDPDIKLNCNTNEPEVEPHKSSSQTQKYRKTTRPHRPEDNNNPSTNDRGKHDYSDPPTGYGRSEAPSDYDYLLYSQEPWESMDMSTLILVVLLCILLFIMYCTCGKIATEPKVSNMMTNVVSRV